MLLNNINSLALSILDLKYLNNIKFSSVFISAAAHSLRWQHSGKLQIDKILGH